MRTVKFVDLGRQYLSLRDAILRKFDAVSREGAYVLGPELAEFEGKFARYCGTDFAIGVANGSDALMLSLLALGIGGGDEVITAPNSFVATAWAIARTGARIVFCDVGDDMNLSPAQIEAAITSRTRAVLPVHLTGRVADMEAIGALARRHGLIVVEDAAQAAGARHRGRRAGSFGVAAGFSLHPLKNLHVHGDGGVITTSDASLCETLLKYRNHGLRSRDECEFWGINSRLDCVQAAIATLKLDHLDQWNARFRQIAHYYSTNLGDRVLTPTEHEYEEPIYHRYMIRHPERDRLQRFLLERGVETRVNYPIPLHLQPAAAGMGYSRGAFPKTEELADTILSLPIYAELEDGEVEHVVRQVREF